MGLYYSLSADNEYESEKRFPNTLSYFFEQTGGYGDKSIVNQVEKILNIDLSIFQKTYNPENEFEFEDFDDEFEQEFSEEELWIDIFEISHLIDNLINTINLNPNYFEKVIFNLSQQPEVPKDASSVNFEKYFQELELFQKENPDSFYPPNNGIITEKNLIKGLHTLKEIIEEFQENDVQKILIHYS